MIRSFPRVTLKTQRHPHQKSRPMTITITLSPDEEKRLLERASLSGQDVEGYIHRLIERHIKASDTLAALLAPVRQQFAESGMSEDELDAIVEEAREDVWREKQARQTKAS
jgi:hypothetical protein